MFNIESRTGKHNYNFHNSNILISEDYTESIIQFRFYFFIEGKLVGSPQYLESRVSSRDLDEIWNGLRDHYSVLIKEIENQNDPNLLEKSVDTEFQTIADFGYRLYDLLCKGENGKIIFDFLLNEFLESQKISNNVRLQITTHTKHKIPFEFLTNSKNYSSNSLLGSKYILSRAPCKRGELTNNQATTIPKFAYYVNDELEFSEYYEKKIFRVLEKVDFVCAKNINGVNKISEEHLFKTFEQKDTKFIHIATHLYRKPNNQDSYIKFCGYDLSLKNLSKLPDLSGKFIFLNTCNSGINSVELINDFTEEFLQKGASVISVSTKIPNKLAGIIASQFYYRLFFNNEPMDVALHNAINKLKSRKLKNGKWFKDIGGLFYSIYGNMSIN